MLFSLHRYIVTSLHRYIVTSLHRYIVTSLHRYIVTSLHRYIVTSLHRYIVTSLHLLINLITPPTPRLLSGGSKRANALYRFLFTRFYKYLVSCKYLVSEKTKSKAQTCGLPQSVKLFSLPLCIKSELVLNWFSHYSRTSFHYLKTALKNYISYLFYFFHRSSFFRQLSFLRQLSFPRRRESSKNFVPLTAIKLLVQGVCQNKHPLGVRRQESRLVHYLKSFFHREKNRAQNLKHAVCYKVSSFQLTTLYQIRTRFEHGFSLCNEAYMFLFSNLVFLPLSFLRPLSFLHPLSFPRRRESRKLFVHNKVQRGLFAYDYFMRIGEKPSQKLWTAVYRKSVSQRLPLCVKSELVLNWFFPLYQRNSLLSDIDRDNVEQESTQIETHGGSNV